jgi:hypothetical protein
MASGKTSSPPLLCSTFRSETRQDETASHFHSLTLFHSPGLVPTSPQPDYKHRTSKGRVLSSRCFFMPCLANIRAQASPLHAHISALLSITLRFLSRALPTNVPNPNPVTFLPSPNPTSFLPETWHSLCTPDHPPPKISHLQFLSLEAHRSVQLTIRIDELTPPFSPPAQITAASTEINSLASSRDHLAANECKRKFLVF